MNLYVNLINDLLNCSFQYKNHEMTIDEYHNKIKQAELMIENNEHKELRKFLMLMENEIDYLRVINNPHDFMYIEGYNESNIYEKMIPIVEKIIEVCQKYNNRI